MRNDLPNQSNSHKEVVDIEYLHPTQSEDKSFFSHPSEAELEAGLTCEDGETVGQYVRKFRDITLRRGGVPVTIKDLEYWECESCGTFVTSREEMKRIQELARQQTAYTGRLTLRLSPELHQQLAEEAHNNHRSLNNELAYRLRQSLKRSES